MVLLASASHELPMLRVMVLVRSLAWFRMVVVSWSDLMFSSLLELMLIWLLALKVEARMLVEPVALDFASAAASNEPESMLMLFAEVKFVEAKEFCVVVVVFELPV